MEITVNSKTHGKKIFLIDDEDYEKIKDYTWCIVKDKNSGNFYVRTSVRGDRFKKILLHRLILDCYDKKIIDHSDGNTLNNKKNNLRICNKSKNAMNSKKRNDALTSKYKGVHFNTRTQKYVAKIIVDGKTTHIGYFDSELNAAKAYNKYSKIYHGAYSRINEGI